jgi:UDP-N-acetylmuramoyl-L-alanyl-D-glutamate--2,6-diaminopimelate ligase
MDIKRLLKSMDYSSIHGEARGDVKGISYDSRKVRKDYIFVAIPGEKDDGTRYENQAARSGAVAIVSKAYNPSLDRVLQIIVDNPRLTLSALSREFYDNPSAKLSVIGITGTNGKTTTTYLIESIFKAASRKPVIIGTVNYRFMDKRIKAINTTPESLDLNMMMNDFLLQGATDAIMEVSSHAIVQGRVNGINFDIAIFTNLTQDHLDYHKTMEDYYAAKAMLFDKILVASHKSKKFAILNSDDPWVSRLKIKRGIHTLRFGDSRHADIKLMSSSASLDGITMKLSTPIGMIDLSSPLVGHYNIYNIMAAIAASIVSNISMEHIKQGVESLVSVPGRVEKIDNPKGVYAFVDYAHTPDALEKVLIALSELKKKRIICVFGCGGDRDKGKRPIMGDIATRLSDIAIITSDNPRSEEPAAIMSDIEKGIKNAARVESLYPGIELHTKSYMAIQDRKQAIKTALDISERGDVVLVAGKGHEDYQIFSDRTIHFSDKEEIVNYFGLPL